MAAKRGGGRNPEGQTPAGVASGEVDEGGADRKSMRSRRVKGQLTLSKEKTSTLADEDEMDAYSEGSDGEGDADTENSEDEYDGEETGYDHSEMMERYDQCLAVDPVLRQESVNDMKFTFIPGNMWDQHMTRKRRNRPNYEFNRVRQMVRRVTGQMLQNKPAIKVRPSKNGAVDIAEIMTGIIRNIEVNSQAETAYDTCNQWAVGGGRGIVRLITEYQSDDSFDQCLKIVDVPDPNTVYFDPSAKRFDRMDMNFCFIVDRISKAEHKRRWPGKAICDFNAPTNIGLLTQWAWANEVLVAEYFYVCYEKKTILLLEDGSVVDKGEYDEFIKELPPGAVAPPVVRERETQERVVRSTIVNGYGPLEEPVRWPGKYIPVAVQWGDMVSVDGLQYYSGMPRFAKDAARVHNFELSTAIEVLAKLPNSPLMATAKMIEGYKSYYERMGYDDPPVMLYNIDPDAPGEKPERQSLAQFPAALANMSQVAIDEMKATTGVYDASLGARSNETSGRAIIARKEEGDVGNYNYTDNQVKMLTSLGRMLVDSIPRVYDAQQVVRVIGEDNKEKFVEVNKVFLAPDPANPDEMIEKMDNNLSLGTYDVTVTVGKSFDTARMETAETAQALAQAEGPLGLLGQYLLLENLDVPGMDVFKKAARQVLVSQGLIPPEEGDTPPAPPEPNPADIAKAKKDESSARLNDAKTVEIMETLPTTIASAEANIAKDNADAMGAFNDAGFAAADEQPEPVPGGGAFP